MLPPSDLHHAMRWQIKRDGGRAVPSSNGRTPSCRALRALRDGTFHLPGDLRPRSKGAAYALCRGKIVVRVIPSERVLPDATTTGTPVADSASEQPPVIRRAEVVAFALVSLLVIAVITVLYFGKPFFLPVVMAFVIGTMLSPAANFLERHKIPRSLGAVLIVLTVTAAAA